MTFFETRNGVNLDITFRCPLECSKCSRQHYYAKRNKIVEGQDMSLSTFMKITNHFKKLIFCGQISDPVNHPKFIDFLKICFKLKKQITVHTANSHKPIEWYKKAFESNINAEWFFGLDGLPKDSHIYRKNQDGKKLFDIMLLAKNILKKKPVWQYIIFSYNEKDIETAKEIAKKENLVLKLIVSKRFEKRDTLKPTNNLFYVKKN
jgi:MoaA/NifB/PqqE/SkfB family radical SAM enzyme